MQARYKTGLTRRRGGRENYRRLDEEMSEATIPVREGEAFDVARVMAYLRERLPEIPKGEPEVRQFPTGASNLTYLLRVAGWEESMTDDALLEAIAAARRADQ